MLALDASWEFNGLLWKYRYDVNYVYIFPAYDEHFWFGLEFRVLRLFNGSPFSVPCFRYFMKTCLPQRVHAAASHALLFRGIIEEVFILINVRSFPCSSFSVITDRWKLCEPIM